MLDLVTCTDVLAALTALSRGTGKVRHPVSRKV